MAALVISIRRPVLHQQVGARLRQLIVEGAHRAGPQAQRARAERTAAGLAHAAARGDQDARRRRPGRAAAEPRRGGASCRADVADTFEVIAGLEGQSGELAAERISDAELAEIRALHYEMLAAHARPATIGRSTTRSTPRRATRADADLPHRQRAPAGAALPLQLRRREVDARGRGARGMIERLARATARLCAACWSSTSSTSATRARADARPRRPTLAAWPRDGAPGRAQAARSRTLAHARMRCSVKAAVADRPEPAMNAPLPAP